MQVARLEGCGGSDEDNSVDKGDRAMDTDRQQASPEGEIRTRLIVGTGNLLLSFLVFNLQWQQELTI